MEIKKNCNNCAHYKHSPSRSVCMSCWRHSNWQPNENVQHIILTTSDTMDAINKYIEEDINMTKTSYNYFFKNGDSSKITKKIRFNKGFEIEIRDNIKDVIFNDPATIILWKDGSKTVVKAQDGELYDPEKGFAMAIAKKVLGGQGNYFEVFKKWIPEEEKVKKIYEFKCNLGEASDYIYEIQKSLYDKIAGDAVKEALNSIYGSKAFKKQEESEEDNSDEV